MKFTVRTTCLAGDRVCFSSCSVRVGRGQDAKPPAAAGRPALRETRFDFSPFTVRDRRPCKSHATRPCGSAAYFDAMRVAVDVNPYEHAEGKVEIFRVFHVLCGG